jgi:hypothetical protein
MSKPPPNRKKATSAAKSDSKTSANSANEDISQQVDPATATITVAAVEIPELTEEEQRDRLHLERRVERAVFEAGKALAELRDRRLYRSTHKTFEEYCRVRPWRWRSHRFAHSRQQSNYLIAAAGVYENLTTNGTQILPTSERQVRPMTKLEPHEQQEVWLRAVELAGGKVPTGRIVKHVVQRIMERTKVPNTYQIGEVCQILVKDNPELRGKGGCWGIVSAVNEFSCTVRLWDGEYTIGLKHLKSCDYLPSECQQVQEISDAYGGLFGVASVESIPVR